MSIETFERPPAKSWEEVDTHLMYTQSGVRRIEAAVAKLAENVATKSDIDNLIKRFDNYATKSELEAKIAALEAKLTTALERLQGSTPASLWTGLAKFSGQAAVIAALVLLIIKLAKLAP